MLTAATRVKDIRRARCETSAALASQPGSRARARSSDAARSAAAAFRELDRAEPRDGFDS